MPWTYFFKGFTVYSNCIKRQFPWISKAFESYHSLCKWDPEVSSQISRKWRKHGKKTTPEIPALYDFQCLFLHFLSVMPFFISCTSSKSCMSSKCCECYPTEKEASFLKKCTLHFLLTDQQTEIWIWNLFDAFLYDHFFLVNWWCNNRK